MSFYNTGNPVPSIDPRDLDDNAKHIDELTNSTFPTFVDRLGVTRRTLAGIEADNSLLTSPGGAALVGFGERNVADALLGAKNVDDFGAIGDGDLHPLHEKYATLAAAQVDYPFATSLSQSIDWAAWQKVGLSGSIITGSDKEYVLSDPLMLLQSSIRMPGGKSRLVFTNTGDGLFFQPTLFATSNRASGFALLKKGVNGGTAIRTANDPEQYYTLKSRFAWEDLTIGGYTALPPLVAAGHERVESWDCAIHQMQSFNTKISAVDIFGNYNISLADAGQQVTTGFRFGETGMDGVTASIYVNGCTIASTRTHVEFTGGTFWHIDNCDFAHGFDGIIQVGSLGPSEVKITNSNLNVQRTGVYAEGPTSVEWDILTIRRHNKGVVNADHDWKGIYLNTGSKVKTGGLEIQPSIQTGVGRTSIGVHTVGTSAVFVEKGTFGLFLDYAIFADNCVQLQTGMLSMAHVPNRNVKQYAFGLVNNTRNSVLGPTTYSSSYSGGDIEIDGTIGASAFKNYDRSVNPEASTPIYKYYKRDAPADQKRTQTVTSATTWNLQIVSDDETVTSNAIIVTRSGTSTVSTDIRGQLIANQVVPRVTSVNSLGTTLLQWSDVLSIKGTFSGPVRPGQYTLATLPSAAAFSGYEIDVTDATGGSKRCRSNGSVWQILNTTTTVS